GYCKAWPCHSQCAGSHSGPVTGVPPTAGAAYQRPQDTLTRPAPVMATVDCLQVDASRDQSCFTGKPTESVRSSTRTTVRVDDRMRSGAAGGVKIARDPGIDLASPLPIRSPGKLYGFPGHLRIPLEPAADIPRVAGRHAQFATRALRRETYVVKIEGFD